MTQDMRKRRRNRKKFLQRFFMYCEEKRRPGLKFRPGLTGEGTADIILIESSYLVMSK